MAVAVDTPQLTFAVESYRRELMLERRDIYKIRPIKRNLTKHIGSLCIAYIGARRIHLARNIVVGKGVRTVYIIGVSLDIYGIYCPVSDIHLIKEKLIAAVRLHTALEVIIAVGVCTAMIFDPLFLS